MYFELCAVFVIALSLVHGTSLELLTDIQFDDVYLNVSAYTGFTQMTPMPLPLSDITATLVPGSIFGATYSDRIYVIGGCDTEQSCYSYKTNNESTLSCSCTHCTNACNYYNVVNNTWTACAPAPIPRYRHTAALINNEIWVTGGRSIPNDDILLQVDVYDPKADKWTTKSGFEYDQLNSDGASFASGSYWYLIGGYNKNYTSQKSMYRLNTTSGEWTTMKSMLYDRGDVSVQQLGGAFYAVGGWTSSNGFCQPLTLVEKYNIATNLWMKAPDMIYARGKPALGDIGNYLFAIGGETKPQSDLTCSHSEPVPYSSRLSASSQKWVVEQSISESVYRFAGVTYYGSTLYKQGPAIYLFGGQGVYNASSSSYNLKSTVLQYIPASTVHNAAPTSNATGLSGGAIAGIVIAVLIVAALVGWFIYRSRRKASPRRGMSLSYDIEESSLFGAPERY